MHLNGFEVFSPIRYRYHGVEMSSSWNLNTSNRNETFGEAHQ